jgi:hypothetical protein
MHKNIILRIALYECETWSLALREEHKMKGFFNTVLGRIIRSKEEEVREERRKLQSEDLLRQIYYLEQIKKNGSGGI